MANMTFGQMNEEAKKTGGFEPLPIGVHEMFVESADVKKGSAGYPQVQARLVIASGAYAGRGTINTMAPIKNDGDINSMFFQQLKALGLGEESAVRQQTAAMGIDQALPIIASAMVGARALVTINHRQWGDETRDNVKKIAPLGAGAPAATAPVAAAMPVAPMAQPVTPQAAPVTPVEPPQTPAPAPVAPAAPVAPVAPVSPPVAPPMAAPVAPVAPVAPMPAAEVPAPAVTADPVAAVEAQFPTPPEGSGF